MVFPVVQLCGITTGIPHNIFVRSCGNGQKNHRIMLWYFPVVFSCGIFLWYFPEIFSCGIFYGISCGTTVWYYHRNTTRYFCKGSPYRNNTDRRDRRPRPQLLCHYCHIPGHVWRECRKRHRDMTRPPPPPPSPHSYYNYGQYHPQQPYNGPQQPQTQTYLPPQDF